MKNGNLVTTIEIKDRQGRVIDVKEVVTYAGLLNRAHQEGLKKVITKLIQRPTQANEMTAISMAEVETDKGVYRDFGDANPKNVTSKIVPHIIRMAVTRAKARAFRDAVNIGIVALEELAEDYQNGVDKKPESTSRDKDKTAIPKKPDDHNQHQSSNQTSGYSNDDSMTENQRRYLFRLLAERGVRGDDAHDYLKNEFQVESLNEVSKQDASDMINFLLSEENKTEEGVAC